MNRIKIEIEFTLNHVRSSLYYTLRRSRGRAPPSFARRFVFNTHSLENGALCKEFVCIIICRIHQRISEGISLYTCCGENRSVENVMAMYDHCWRAVELV